MPPATASVGVSSIVGPNAIDQTSVGDETLTPTSWLVCTFQTLTMLSRALEAIYFPVASDATEITPSV